MWGPIENSCMEKTYMHVQNVQNCGSCREWVWRKCTCMYKTYGKLQHSVPPQDAVFHMFCTCMYVFSIHEFSIRGCVCFLYGVGDMRVFMWCREYVFFIERGIGKMCFYKSIFQQKMKEQRFYLYILKQLIRLLNQRII